MSRIGVRRWVSIHPLATLCTLACVLWLATSSMLAGASKPKGARIGAEELEYDFVVVGGGSTGSIVAARLAQARHRVLLLEAGGPTQAPLGGHDVQRVWKSLLEAPMDEYEDEGSQGELPSPLSLPLPTVFDVPLEWHTVLSSPNIARRFEWQLVDEPRPAIARGLGGCSIHNAMVYIRGLDDDFDGAHHQHAEEGRVNGTGKPVRAWPKNWSFDDVLPFYRRSVSQRNPLLAGLPQHHPSPLPPLSKGGPVRGGEVHLSSLHPDDVDPLSRRVLQAWTSPRSRGNDSALEAPLLPRLDDMNDPTRREGVGYYQFLIKEGRRHTVAAELFGAQPPDQTSPAGGGTLHVRTNVQATRLVFDNSTGVPRASGVEVVVFRPDSYSTHGRSPRDVPRGSSPHPPHSPPFIVRARHEVIVSAGAINTPKLLLQSGIGPADPLRLAGVPLVSPLRGVGSNLMDGAKVLLQFRLRHHGKFRPCMFEEKEEATERTYNHSTTKQHQRRCEEQRAKWMRGQLVAAARAANAREGGTVEDDDDSSDPLSSDAAAAAAPPLPSPISFGEFGGPGFAVGAFLRTHPRHVLPNIQATIFPFDILRRDWAGASAAGMVEGAEGLGAWGEGVMTVEVILNNPKSRGAVSLRPPLPPPPPPSSNAAMQANSTVLSAKSRAAAAAAASSSGSDAADARRIAHSLLPPRVHLASFDDDSDVNEMVEAVRLVRRLMGAPDLAQHVGAELLPGVELDEEELRDFVRCGPKAFRKRGQVCAAEQRVVNHLAGTARMGSRTHVSDAVVKGSDDDAASDDDDGSVVDPSLRVHGVVGLRVADASVMPVLPSGNTHATCQMIGERAAHFLLEQYPPPKAPSDDDQSSSGSKKRKKRSRPAASRSDIRDMECPPHGHCHIPALEVKDDEDGLDSSLTAGRLGTVTWLPSSRSQRYEGPRRGDDDDDERDERRRGNGHSVADALDNRPVATPTPAPEGSASTVLLLGLLVVTMLFMWFILHQLGRDQRRDPASRPLLAPSIIAT